MNRMGRKGMGKYKADGYSEGDKLVYEFNWCFYHGSPQCLHPDTIHPKINVFVQELHRGKTRKLPLKMDGVVSYRNVGV